MASMDRVAASVTEGPGQDVAQAPLHPTFHRLLALYVIVLYPLLRANRYYDDDLKRALIGRTGWDSNGRPLTTLLMKSLQAYDHALVDISPLPQLAAVALLAWAGALLARRYEIRPPWLAALVTLPLGAQPFFLENLSYKFDALSMGLAVLLVLVPIVTPATSRSRWGWGVAAIFASLSLYQPAICVLLVFAMLELVMATLAALPLRDAGRRGLSLAGQTVAGMAVYQVLIGSHIHGWVQQNARLVQVPDGLPQVAANYSAFCAFVIAAFNGHWWSFFALPVLMLLLLPMVVLIRYARQQGSASMGTARILLPALGAVTPLLALAAALGPMLLLATPLIVPRVMLGVGALVSAGLVLAQASFRQWRWPLPWAYGLAGMFAVGMGVHASAYGNAAAEQKAYEDRLGGQIADDISQVRAGQPLAYYLVEGSDGLAPIPAHVATQFPLVGMLVRPYLSASDVFNTDHFLMFYMPEISDMRRQPGPRAAVLEQALLAKTCEAVPWRVARSYRLYIVEDTVVISFGGARAARCDRRVAGRRPSAGTSTSTKT